MTAVVQESHVRKRGTGTSSGIARDHLHSFPLQRLCFSPKAIPLEFNRQNPSKPKALQPVPFPELLQLDMRISSGHRFPVGDAILGPLLVTFTTEHVFPRYLPALARLLPKLNGGVAVVETPKFPILKFTAGLAANPKPPKLNPLAVEFAVSSPPNPDEREAEKEQGNISSE